MALVAVGLVVHVLLLGAIPDIVPVGDCHVDDCLLTRWQRHWRCKADHEGVFWASVAYLGGCACHAGLLVCQFYRAEIQACALDL